MKHLSKIEDCIYRTQIKTKDGATFSLCGFRRSARTLIVEDGSGNLRELMRMDVASVQTLESKWKDAK